MTLGKLARQLNKFIEKYPQFQDLEVSHAAECGFSAAGFHEPLTIAIPTIAKEFMPREPYAKIVSDDDGFSRNPAISEWNFYTLEGKVPKGEKI